MKKTSTLVAIIVLLVAGAFGGATAGQLVPGLAGKSASAATLDVQPTGLLAPAGTAFTYQGKLNSGGNPATGQFDFQFGLYDAATNGQLLDSDSLTNVTVTSGLFTVALNFNAGLFNGQARWLQIAVRPANNGNYVLLTPRQELKPAPQAIFAQNAPWTGVTGKPDAFNPQTPGFRLNNLDTTGDVGINSSITLGVDGLGLMSYWDTTNSALKVAHCADVACSSATFTTVDNSAAVGDWSAITIGADGLGLIAYYDSTNSALKVAHCSNLDCSQSINTTIDNSAAVGQYPAITVSSDRRTGQRYMHGLIAYYDDTNTALKVALCNNITCTSADTYTADNDASVGQYASITGNVNGNPLISYYDASNSALKVAYCNNTHCLNGTSTRTLLDNPNNTIVGQYTSIAVGSDGLPLISYYDATNFDLKVAHCNSIGCLTASIEVFDGGNGGVAVGDYSSITIGRDGMPIISYHDIANNLLAVGHCKNYTCSSHTIVNPGQGLGVANGLFTSTTIGSDGYPLLSYYNASNDDLVVIHCSNEFCSPNQLRR